MIQELQKQRSEKLMTARRCIRSIKDDTPMDEARALEREYDLAMAEVEELQDRIQDERDNSLSGPVVRGENISCAAVDDSSNNHSQAFARWLRAPRDDRARQELHQTEPRAANTLTSTQGGFIVPEVIARPMMMRARDANTLRPIVRTIQVSSGDVVLPLSNGDTSSGWVAELDARPKTGEPTLSGPKPTFGTTYALVEASEEMVMDSTFDVAQWFSAEAGAALGEAEALSVVSGSGVAKPTGILHTSPESGADGSRSAGAFKYLASGLAADLGGTDILADLIYDLKASYRSNGRWVMNSKTAGYIRKLKDGDGRSLWADGLAAMEPARLLGYPVTLSEAMPDIGADAHPIGFGDWERAYVLADRGALTVTVDDNITTPGLVKWYIRQRVGGIGYDNNAVRFVKCALT
ncbi:MAG: phage major capsid protein [Pseudomonadota bacterium]